MWGDLAPGRALQVLLRFSPIASLAFLNPEGIKDGPRRRVKFWMERIITNSAGTLSFTGSLVSFPFLTQNTPLLTLTQGTQFIHLLKKETSEK